MITVKNLTKKFGALTAVDNINFHVQKGEVFGFLGPNGAGKTTTVKMLSTLSEPSSGKILVDGRDIRNNQQEIRKIIAVVPQEVNLDKELTVYENLLIHGMLYGLDSVKNKAEQALTKFGLDEKKNSNAAALSGGQKRRLMIARALLSDPALTFMDEPTVGLDPQVRREVWDIIRRTSISGTTVFLTTHYIEEAEMLCDRVAIMTNGVIKSIDTPENIKKGMGSHVVEVYDLNGDTRYIICHDMEEAEAERDQALAGEPEGRAIIREIRLEDVVINETRQSVSSMNKTS